MVVTIAVWLLVAFLLRRRANCRQRGRRNRNPGSAVEWVEQIERSGGRKTRSAIQSRLKWHGRLVHGSAFKTGQRFVKLPCGRLRRGRLDLRSFLHAIAATGARRLRAV